MSGNSIGNGTPLAGPVVVPSPIGSASSTAANANMGSSDSVAGPSGSAGSSALASRVATPTPSTAQAQAQAQAQAHAGSADSSLSMLTYGVAGYVDDDDQVPVCIKHVALLAVRAFYPPDCVVMLDTILRYNQVTEEDLMKFFKLDKDKASLNKTIAVLRSNRFIKEVKIKQVKTPEQKYSKADIISYVVDYESLVNVVKYRLHKINQLLRQQTARLAETADMSMAKYKCAKCGRGSTEVDIVKAQDILQQQLHNPSIPNRDPVILHHDGRLLCYFCGGDVVPDDHAIKLSHAIGARESRFNEQIRQLVLKIKEVDKVTFYDKGYAGIQLPQAPEDAMYAKVSTADVYQAPSAAPALQWRSGRPAGGMGSLPTDNMAVQLADSSKAPVSHCCRLV
ncbi:hypothetical protein, variant [Capsaspora owczarzaki ATCC 30864]|uniref:Transcription initiation factor IIE subunit alpha N-terminal domain-containing protein n=1 Tax=Capsaspora owczarzaki (strain ATCC 30864) TaxID=595528 RepID=A0A0D2UQR2_CAPO3|nr:hypothetical protein, variant [Capsaspora owczarzaki ATCC 30864]